MEPEPVKRVYIECIMRIICLLLLVFVPGSSGPVYAAETDLEIKKMTLGFYGGRSSLRGEFENEIEPGYGIGMFFNFPINIFANKFLFGESEFSYKQYELTESRSSVFTEYSIGAGLLFKYPLFPHLSPFAAVHADINYFHLNAAITEKKENTFKAGVSVRAGLAFPLRKDFSIDGGIKLSANELSGKSYRSITCFAGVSWSFSFIQEQNIEKITRRMELDDLYESGVRLFKEGDGTGALEYFRQIYSHDSAYKDTGHFVKIINSNREKYTVAMDLIEKNDMFDALALLLEAEDILLEAKKKTGELRHDLRKQEGEYEKKGINAFNNGDMERAVYYFNRLILINPENKTAKLYLPRAERRYEALKRLK